MPKSTPTDILLLVVDDQHEMRKIICQYLRQAGFEDVHEADNGEKALEMMEYYAPDIVICDIHMDKMDGMEFVARVRRGKARVDTNTPILILTGEDEPLVHDVTRQIGATRVLTKPIGADDLLREVEEAFQEFGRATRPDLPFNMDF